MRTDNDNLDMESDRDLALFFDASRVRAFLHDDLPPAWMSLQDPVAFCELGLEQSRFDLALW